MEVDEGAPSSVLTNTPSSVSVSLHPLVVMNISDHFTRVRVQQEEPTTTHKGVYSKWSTPWGTYCPPFPHAIVYGALLGVQEGRNIEICNSFELLVNCIDGRVAHDAEYFTEKEKQCMFAVCVYVCVHVL